jgi:hypothetical protein
LRYWSNGTPSRTKADGFNAINVYYVGPERGGPRCHHSASLNIADLPAWDWYDLSPS